MTFSIIKQPFYLPTHLIWRLTSVFSPWASCPTHALCRFVVVNVVVPLQDLPDSVQVGGRINPQLVWDYFDKIRATGTKVSVCVCVCVCVKLFFWGRIDAVAAFVLHVVTGE